MLFQKDETINVFKILGVLAVTMVISLSAMIFFNATKDYRCQSQGGIVTQGTCVKAVSSVQGN